MPQLILASSSPYRRQLLERLQLPFSVVSPDIDETPLIDEAPQTTAIRLAHKKAEKVAHSHPDSLIIGCDQAATLNGLPLGKPLNHDNAVKQLKLISGHSVTFHSALCLLNASSGNIQTKIVPYDVHFRQLSNEQIENYLSKEQPYDCAGSAKSEGLGIALIERMCGDDPNALIGLPLIHLIKMLEQEGISVI